MLAPKAVVDVSNFVPVADGTTNVTAAIHRARDAAAPKLIFPAGIYLVSGLTANVAKQQWVFEPGATIKLADSSNAALLSITAAGVEIRGGQWNGNQANQSSGTDCIIVSRVASVVLDGLTVTNGKGYGIRALHSDKVRIRNCDVSGSTNVGIFVEADAAQASDTYGPLIQGCTVDRTALGSGINEGGIKVHGNTPRKVLRPRIIGNDVMMPNNPTASNAIAIEVWGGSDRATITGNTTVGGYMSISVDNSPRSTVSGNTTYDAKQYGIEIASSASCAVTGNTMDGNSLTTRGIVLDGASGSPGAAITGNTVRGCTSRSIYAIDADRCVISGNTVDCSAGHAIYLQNLDHGTISGNMLYGTGTAAKAIWLDTSTGIVITGNDCFSFTENGVYLYATTAVTISNIVITGNQFVSVNVAIGTAVSGGAALGSSVRVAGNVGVGDYADYNARVGFLTGTGSPEGVTTAGIGSIFRRTDGGTSTTLYIKESGTGNTGWIAK